MIRVPVVDIQYPDGWMERAKAAKADIEACVDRAARRNLLDGHHAEVWKALRGEMAKVSHDKCWYCETPITRDDLVVDHYRPKGRVFEEDKDNEGYWWLAFAANNFRLACKYCNELRDDKEGGTKGGKGTHFPLLEGSVRATTANRDTSREYPVLLDPVEQADVDELMLLADSKASPRYGKDINPVAFYRATVTIDILHLNHRRLRGARGQICNQVAEAVERCEVAYRYYLEKMASSADTLSMAEARRPYRDAVQRLADFLKPSSPYAGAAKSVVRQARSASGREWLDVLLQS